MFLSVTISCTYLVFDENPFFNMCLLKKIIYQVLNKREQKSLPSEGLHFSRELIVYFLNAILRQKECLMAD